MSRKKSAETPVLRAVPQETDLKKLPPKRTFWNTCPLKAESLPETPCETGRESCKKLEQHPCPWAIDSAEDNFCFWVWLRRRSDADGNMQPLKQDDCAKLLNWSSTRVHFTTKAAIQSVKGGKFASVLATLHKDKSDAEDGEEVMPVAMQIPEESQED